MPVNDNLNKILDIEPQETSSEDIEIGNIKQEDEQNSIVLETPKQKNLEKKETFDVKTPEEKKEEEYIKNIDDDLEVARNRLKELMDKEDEAINEMKTIADDTENNRAYEVLGQLIRGATETARLLVELHGKARQAREGDGKKKENPSNVTNNNVIFSGPTEDVQRNIQDIIQAAKNAKK